jgi:hypothetical protein
LQAGNYPQVDYQQLRKQLWRRRIAFVIAVVLSGLVVMQYSANIFDSKTAVVDSMLEPSQSISNTPESWQTILQNLDKVRELAISRKDESQLDDVFIEDSSLRSQDEELIQNLIMQNLLVVGLEFELIAVEQISHRWSNAEEVVELRVTDKRSSYLIQSQNGETRIPEREPEVWVVSLHKIGERWLIGNAEPDLDDR